MGPQGFWFESARGWLYSISVPKLDADSAAIQFLGETALIIYKERKAVLSFAYVLAAAIFPIYIGSHASLRCPPSAVEPSDATTREDEDDDDLEDPEKSIPQGLSPSDAVLFPIVGACVLTALYFLIKWFEDPSIISRVLGWYFSACSVFAVGNLISDGLNAGTSFIFPTYWSSGDQLYYIDKSHLRHVSKSPITGSNGGSHVHEKFGDIHSPFPRNLIFNLSRKNIARMWTIRGLFLGRWVFRGYIHGGFVNIKSKVRLNVIIGQLASVFVITLYNTNGKAPWLSNLMGFGLCYSTLRLLSPTTFWTGSLVLAGLFVYDIFMVFFTPMMTTVATSLDIPIKLVFHGGGILGLGDIVLPGLMIAMALRFDLYLHYLRKPAAVTNLSALTPSTNPKPIYNSATGHWGERYWTRSLQRSALPPALSGLVFRKTYFHASLAGYSLGMIATYSVLIVFKRGQPALMYLVPAVLFSVWMTAVVYGDLAEMWRYTEAWDMDGDIHFQKERAEGKGIMKSEKSIQRSLNVMHNVQICFGETAESIKAYQVGEDKATNAENSPGNDQPKKAPVKDPPQHIFLFSLHAPQRTPARERKSV